MAILCKMQDAFYRAVSPSPLYLDTIGLHLTSVLHNGTGALTRMCVQSIALNMFGSPAKALALLL